MIAYLHHSLEVLDLERQVPFPQVALHSPLQRACIPLAAVDHGLEVRRRLR